MADKKVVFVAFAIEDVGQRDMLKGHSLNPKCPYEYIDYSVKEAYESDWKDKVRTRIRRSDGVIVLVSKNSLTSTGQNGRSSARRKRRSRFMPSGFTRMTARRLRASRPKFGHGMALPTLSTACRVRGRECARRLLLGSITTRR
jgi:hypothetical protein